MQFQRLTKKQLVKGALSVAGLLLLVLGIQFVYMTYLDMPTEFITYDSGQTEFNRGHVVEVTKESLELIPDSGGRYLGKQEIIVEMKSGAFEGEVITLQNALSTTHNIQAKAGQSLIIRVQTAQGADPYFSVYNYDRTPGIIGIVLVFIIATVAVGGVKGFRSVVGLLFTLFFILAFLLPAIYNGYSPVLCAMLTVAITASVTLLLLNGFSTKTLCAIAATLAGVAMTGVMFALFSFVLKVSGYTLGETEELILISSNTGLRIHEVLFAGALISSLGAVMDTSLSLSSALLELKRVNPEITMRRLLKAGMNIGKDMIGTMTNTLILAFVGAAIVTLLVLFSYGVALEQLMSSDYIAVEIVHGISGSIGIVLSVPFASVICAWLYSRMSSTEIEKEA